MLPVRNASLVCAQVPHARLEVIDRCGHCPQVERPRLTARLLAEFVRGLATAQRRPR